MPRTNVKDKRKQQLMQATMDSIAKRGLTETTITHISKGAGMSRGIINFYFTSKERMMRETLATLVSEYDEYWQAALKEGAPAEQKLQAVIRALFDAKLCQPKRLNVMSAFWAHAATHKAYREIIQQSDAALRAVITTLFVEMGQKDAEATRYAAQLLSLVQGMWLQYLLDPQHADRDELANYCLGFIEMLRTPVKVVKSAPAAKPVAKPAAIAKRPAKKPAKKREALDDGQMDIEDLFKAAR